MRAFELLLGISLLSIGCSAAPAEDVAESEDELRTSYANILETLDGSYLDRWIAARAEVVKGFDNICGDTICSGDFSNLTTVELACSSTRAALKMKDCLWVLGGNIDVVDGRTGKITTEARTFTCHVPVAGNAKQLVDTLANAGDDALNAPLPGTGHTFYDALVDCFDGVVGSPYPEQTHSFYSELADYFWESPEAGAAWWSTQQKLRSGFDAACGDSFCEGEYSDISALRFTCAVNRNTTRVPRCAWTFAGADISVGARGQLEARTTTKRCYVTIGATANALKDALAGDDPLHAPLPGRTTSIYDALVGCL